MRHETGPTLGRGERIFDQRNISISSQHIALVEPVSLSGLVSLQNLHVLIR